MKNVRHSTRKRINFFSIFRLSKICRLSHLKLVFKHFEHEVLKTALIPFVENFQPKIGIVCTWKDQSSEHYFFFYKKCHRKKSSQAWLLGEIQKLCLYWKICKFENKHNIKSKIYTISNHELYYSVRIFFLQMSILIKLIIIATNLVFSNF